MTIRKVTRYVSYCGRGYWKKSTCLSHEINCKCWTNPKLRTCKTCKFYTRYKDSNGMEHEPQYFQTWVQNECTNEKFNEYEPFLNVAHEKAPDLYINCPLWQSLK